MDTQYPNIDTLRRRFQLPSLLVKLMNSGDWSRADPERVKRCVRCVPFIQDPLVILETFDSMLRNSGPLMRHDQSEDEIFHEYRGSCSPARPLPWIDVERTIFIMCNERIGDDCGIALDYRLDVNQPRVIGSDWHSGMNGVQYRQIADSFSDFASAIGLPTVLDGV